MRLSVIVPGCNTCKEWWIRCVSSILKRIQKDDEILVVDDGSTVPVNGAWFGDARVRVLRKENGGLSSARNFGLEEARGDYVAFVDSDDEICDDVMNECVLSLSRSDSDIAVFGVRTIWTEEELQKEDKIPLHLSDSLKGVLLSPNNVRELIRARLFNYACNKVYRASFLKQNKLRFDLQGMPCEDIIFNLSCLIANAKWCFVDIVGYVYYRTGMTLLSRYKPSNFVGLHQASTMWKRYKELYPEAQDVFGNFGEISENDIAMAEKRNLLKPGSPYWLSKPYNILRSLLYIKPVRRWNIKRQYPNVTEI